MLPCNRFRVHRSGVAWYGFGAWALVGALVTQHLTRAVALLVGQPHPKWPLLERQAIADLLFFGGGFTLARVCNFLAGQVDKLIVGRFLGAQALGIYALASQLMTAPAVIFGQILDRVLFPTMALVQQEQARLARAYRSGVAACALFTIPAGLILAIIAPELVFVLLGTGWGSCPAASDPSARHAVPHELQAQRHDCARNRRGICPCMAASRFCHCHRGGLVDWAVLGLTGCRDRHRRRNRNELFFNGAAEPDLNGYKLAGFRQGACSRHSARGHTGLIMGCGKPPTLEVSAIVVLIDVAILSILSGLALCWLMPALFLGDDGRSAVAPLDLDAALAPTASERCLTNPLVISSSAY